METLYQPYNGSPRKSPLPELLARDIMLTVFNRRREDNLVLAINKLAVSIGGGLRAIALAMSTPQDNSAQVQAEIDRLVQQMAASDTDLEDAQKQHKSNNNLI